jgi:hypothetical protein
LKNRRRTWRVNISMTSERSRKMSKLLDESNHESKLLANLERRGEQGGIL